MFAVTVLLLAGACVAQSPLRGGSLPPQFPSGSARSLSVVLDDAGTASLVPGSPPAVAKAAAWGSFEDAINETGWSVLRIQTSDKMSGAMQSYAAGFLEASLTHERMTQHRKNMWGIDLPGMRLPVAIRDFLKSNLEWMNEEVREQPSEPYWKLAGFMLDQLRGLTDGYNAARSRFDEPALSTDQIYMMSLIDADMDDLTLALKAQGYSLQEPAPSHRKSLNNPRHRGHCSALIQCAPGNADIFVGHATWDSYRAMLRMMKHLDMPLPGAELRRMAFSSNPGSLYSADDFYVTDTGLAIVETTIDNHNQSLWLNVKPQSMMTWARAMLANRLARTGAQWTELMLRHNSGTCNNQWMVVDYKRFSPGQTSFREGTLWVSETMPGHARREDVTQILAKQGSWASYNVPYFQNLWTLGGYGTGGAKTADAYSYTSCPRARIFKRARDDNTVTSFASFMKFMRYNRANDPLEEGDRCNGISSRCDLNSPELLDYDCYGGVDSKAVR